MPEKLELQRARGTRDFPPEEKIMRNELIATLVRLFEQFGFSPLETPILERYDVLASKYAGGAEILKETFTLKDQGERDLCLRYDLTVPFARFFGMNPTLKLPFKRYQIGPVFRDGPIKLGRYREFWQCDVDVVGTKNMLADAELVVLAQKFFHQINFDVTIEINNRKFLDGLLAFLGLTEKNVDVLVAVDKLKKIGSADVKKELKQKGLSPTQVEQLFSLLTLPGKNSDKIAILREKITTPAAQEGLREIEELLAYVDRLGDEANVSFEPTLSRGLAYYTGPVFEVFLKDSSESDVKSSLAGGGRYDRMIGTFLGSGEYPAVGISFGIEPIVEQLKIIRAAEKEPMKKSVTQVFLIPIKTLNESLTILSTLRKEGINADIDIIGRGISKNLDYANALGIPYVLIIGAQELAQNKVKLKDMLSGTEELLGVHEVCTRLKG
ncbi:MAG: histidine--tRNA ligase [Candidatus Woesearchaeota archaeon]|nr:histidine--tRNA ligase [Candidatus Woesearchaeota archaeon]